MSGSQRWSRADGNTADSVASPAAKWSGCPMCPDSPRSRCGLVVSRMCGRCLRIILTIARRNSMVGSRYPSGKSRNSTVFSPSIRPASICSSCRMADSCGPVNDRSSVPLLPSVHSTYTTSHPSLAHFAALPEHPQSASSGCATTTIARECGSRSVFVIASSVVMLFPFA